MSTENRTTTDARTTGDNGHNGILRAPKALHEAFMDERNDVLSVVTELEDQLDRYEETRISLERELTESTEKLHKSTQRVQELEWQVVTLQTRIDAGEQLKQDVTVLEEQIGEASRRIGQLDDQLIATEKDNQRLVGELKTANKQLEELWSAKKERDAIRNENKVLKTKINESEAALREIRDERASLNGQLQESQLALDEMRVVKGRLEIETRTAEDRIREMKRVQENLEDKLLTLRNEKKNLQATITHLERENARLNEQRQHFECEVTSLRNMNKTTESALTSVKKAFAEVRAALTETKSRTRRRTLDSLPRLSAGLRGVQQPSNAMTTPEPSLAAVGQDTAGDTADASPDDTTIEPSEDSGIWEGSD
jgi:chromosome segregation ATPase